MNRLITKRIGALMSALFIISSASFSQFDNMDFLKGGVADGAKIIEAYLAPWANAFGAGLNGSWYNTAKPHKFGGFDITTGLNVGFVPASAGTFDVGKIGLTELTGTGNAPTISGPDNNGPTLTKTVSGYTIASFTTPPGTDWKYIPVPTAQIGIGLPFGTEVKARFIPKINIKDGDISLWGIGLMHSIMQYLPGNKILPFDVSLFGGLTKLMANVPLDLQPGTPTGYVTYPVATAFKSQKMSANIDAFNIGVIGSVNLPVITFYGGLGYSKTKTEVKLSGNYPLPRLRPTPLPATVIYDDAGVITKFPEINIENFSGVRANIGFRIKLAVITIHADYTKSQYNVVSAGLGLSFR